MVGRRQEIQEALLKANTGCLLLFVLAFGAPLMGVGGFFVAKSLATVREAEVGTTPSRLHGRFLVS